MRNTPDVVTTIGLLAGFYGVLPPQGMDEDHVVVLWQDEDGWHINAGRWELRDEDWAPHTDAQVAELIAQDQDS